MRPSQLLTASRILNWPILSALGEQVQFSGQLCFSRRETHSFRCLPTVSGASHHQEIFSSPNTSEKELTPTHVSKTQSAPQDNSTVDNESKRASACKAAGRAVAALETVVYVLAVSHGSSRSDLSPKSQTFC